MAKELVAVEQRALTPAQFGDLADVPTELEWLANLTNPKTRRAYRIEVGVWEATDPKVRLTIRCQRDF